MRSLLLAVGIAVIGVSSAAAQPETVILELSSDFVANTPGSFSFPFGAFGGNVDDTGATIDILVQDDNDTFGGFGFGGLPIMGFDASQTFLEIVYQPGALNEAESISVSIEDFDPPASIEAHQFSFPLAGLPTDEFTTARILLSTPAGFINNPADGILNPQLTQIVVQSPFGVADTFDVQIAAVRLVTVPEPAAFGLIATVLGGLGFAGRRQR